MATYQNLARASPFVFLEATSTSESRKPRSK